MVQEQSLQVSELRIRPCELAATMLPLAACTTRASALKGACMRADCPLRSGEGLAMMGSGIFLGRT